MSIYHPPSKSQSVFNPSNFGGLGAGGQITTDYLDANYVQFPVAQGNTTLVGTNVLGNITQQGDFSITGDLLVNDVNVITEIGTKQDELTAGTNISIVSNEVSCDLTGSTNIDITGGVISATGLQNELTAGTNISIVDNIVSCDLTGSTNIDITSGVISTTGLQNELTGGTNISIVDDVVSCDLVGSTNIDITSGVISTTGLQNELTGGTNISIVDDVVSCDLTGSTNIDITSGVISTTGLQEELSAGTNISIVSNEVSCDLTGSTNIDITDGVISATGLATTDELGTKQDTISNFEINGNVNLNTSGTNFDTIVVRRPTNATGITDDYLIDLNELQIWVNDANILIENASSLISSVVSWSNKDIDLGSQKSPTNLYNGVISGDNGVLTLNPSPTDIAIIIKNIPTTKINDIHAVQVLNNTSATLGNRAIGLAIELYNSKNDPDLTTILAQSNEISVMDSVYRFDFPSIDTYTLVFNSGGILPNTGSYVNFVTLEVVTPFSFPFNVIGNLDVSGSLILPTIGDVEDAIQGKQDSLTGGTNISIVDDVVSCDLVGSTNIDITDGVISASGLQNELTAGTNISIVGDVVSCDLTGSTNIDITGGVISTTGLQDAITSSTDLTSNLLTTNNLTINNSLSVDTRKYFDTIVLRRPTGITGEAGDFYIALRELQMNYGSNVLQSSGLESLFVNWAVDKEADLGSLGGGSLNDTSKLYDNVISNEYDAHSKEDNSTSDIALIIKGLSLTLIESIQALVLYNRTGDFNNTTIGLAIELYNSTRDPTFTEILGTTSVITTAVDVYRFDFPDIATYTGFATGESLTNIIREEDATSEVVSVVGSPTEMEGGLTCDTITTTGNVDVGGSLMVEDVNVKDTLTSVQTQVDALINFTGGGVNFRAYTLSSATQSTGQNLNYNIIDYDTENSYDTSNNIYTIVIGGTYVFTLGWSSVVGSTAVINLIRNRNSVETILQQSTNGENTTNHNVFFLTTIAECETGDEIYAYLDSGSCKLIAFSESAPNTLASFSGSRISN